MDGRLADMENGLALTRTSTPLRSVTTLRQVRRWVSHRLFSIEHEVRVMQIAVGLFRILQPIHGLGPKHRRMLRIGSLLHDIGRAEGARRHHIRGCEMILEGRCPPMHHAEQRFAAYAARHHRGAMPTVGHDSRLMLNGERREMRILLGILRAADALDKRNLTPPTVMLRRRGRDLIVDVAVIDQWRKAKKAFRRRRKFRMLEGELGMVTKIRIYPVGQQRA